jgi:antitoxin HicB
MGIVIYKFKRCNCLSKNEEIKYGYCANYGHEKLEELTIKTFEYYMSLPYKIVIYPASEGGYVAELPELPGCLTQGDSWQDTFKMIQDAKAAWIDVAMQDGHIIPEPNKS